MRVGDDDESRTGLCYAVSDDGVELPVVDITHPAFSCAYSPEVLEEIAARTRYGLERSRRLPAFVLRLLGRRSVIMRGMLHANRGYVSGMTTYLLKLGPKDLPQGFGGRLDRQMLSSIGPVACRLRLRQAARQIADAATSALVARSGPLYLLDIAGGVGADAFNALILLTKERRELLAGRQIHLEVLDIDREGPTFGSRAVAALRAEGGPLAGLSIAFSHKVYDWTDASSLADVIAIEHGDFVAVGSSEGGIFEYADDETVAANLTALRDATPADFSMVGSLVRDDNLPWLTRGDGNPGLRLRGLADFSKLVDRAGWEIVQTDTNPLYHVVTLKKERS